MGGTLPAAGRAVETADDVRRSKLAIIYGANTLGAVAGVLLSTFLPLGTARQSEHPLDRLRRECLGRARRGRGLPLCTFRSGWSLALAEGGRELQAGGPVFFVLVAAAVAGLSSCSWRLSGIE